MIAVQIYVNIAEDWVTELENVTSAEFNLISERYSSTMRRLFLDYISVDYKIHSIKVSFFSTFLHVCIFKKSLQNFAQVTDHKSSIN